MTINSSGPDVVLQILLPTVVHFIDEGGESRKCMVGLDIALGVDFLELVPYAVGEILGVGDQGKTFAIPDSLIELG